jgi:hypothetical protein
MNAKVKCVGSPNNMLQYVKIVKTHSGLGLKEAKDFCDSTRENRGKQFILEIRTSVQEFEKEIREHLGDSIQVCNREKERQMKLIIIVACLMVGAFACRKYLQRTRSTNINSPTASLCLAVPASAVYKLHERDSISRDEIIRLIDSATEFLCVPESKNIPVEIMDEERSPESQLKFYIRINLRNGGNIIDKETQYGMKRELPLNVTGKVMQIGFLKNVSILREFNRI